MFNLKQNKSTKNAERKEENNVQKQVGTELNEGHLVPIQPCPVLKQLVRVWGCQTVSI